MRIRLTRFEGLRLALAPGWYELPSHLDLADIRRLLDLLASVLPDVEDVLECRWPDLARMRPSSATLLVVEVPLGVEPATIEPRLRGLPCRFGCWRREGGGHWPAQAWDEMQIKSGLAAWLSKTLRKPSHPLAALGVATLPLDLLVEATCEPIELLVLVESTIEYASRQADEGASIDWPACARWSIARRLADRLAAAAPALLPRMIDSLVHSEGGTLDVLAYVHEVDELARLGLAHHDEGSALLVPLARLAAEQRVLDILDLEGLRRAPIGRQGPTRTRARTRDEALLALDPLTRIGPDDPWFVDLRALAPELLDFSRALRQQVERRDRPARLALVQPASRGGSTLIRRILLDLGASGAIVLPVELRGQGRIAFVELVLAMLQALLGYCETHVDAQLATTQLDALRGWLGEHGLDGELRDYIRLGQGIMASTRLPALLSVLQRVIAATSSESERVRVALDARSDELLARIADVLDGLRGHLAARGQRVVFHFESTKQLAAVQTAELFGAHAEALARLDAGIVVAVADARGLGEGFAVLEVPQLSGPSLAASLEAIVAARVDVEAVLGPGRLEAVVGAGHASVRAGLEAVRQVVAGETVEVARVEAARVEVVEQGEGEVVESVQEMEPEPEALSVEELIERERREKTGFLDLGGQRLEVLPDSLFGLEHLEVLNLDWGYLDESGNRVESRGAGGFRFNTIEHLDPRFVKLGRLRRLFIECIPVDAASLSTLLALEHLECLHMAWNSPSLEPLRHIRALRNVKCRNSQVSDLSPLAGLPSLQSLDCSVTQVGDLSPLAGLASLQSLDCSATQVSDLSPLADLPSLQFLNCWSTQVSDLAPLAGLPSLRFLNCHHTQVSDLSPLAGLLSLRSLNCWSTQVSDLAPLAGLPSLQVLDCSHTQVSDLSPLLSIPSLFLIYADRCTLDALPRALVFHPSLDYLSLYQARVPDLPLSTSNYENCLPRIRAHLRDLEAGAEPLRDAKLIVLGNGRVGKTQLCRRLRGDAFDERIPSTHGIVVDTVELGPSPDDAILNIWDFGGQDIYHGTHALFSRSRAVFLIAWNAASESLQEYEHEGLVFRNQPLAYWLDYVRHIAGPQSAVIVVQTQCDTPLQARKQVPVDAERLEFPHCVTVDYSAKTNRGRAHLDEAIREAIAYLRAREGVVTIGRGRAELIRRLRGWQAEDALLPREQRRHRTLGYPEFEALCREVGGIHSPRLLLRFLHDSGVVFASDEHFGAAIILDQSWALDAVYALFDRSLAYRVLTQLRGRFTLSLLGSLAWAHHAPAEQRLFVDLMLSCGICFVIREADETRGIEAEYVAPDLLPTRAAVQGELDERGWDDAAPSLCVWFEFAFLHFGVIRTLIAKLGAQAQGAGVYWRTGVWVREAGTGASAVVEAQRDDASRGRICVRVQGREGEALARSLVRLLREQADCREATLTVERDGVMLDPRTLEFDHEARPRLDEPPPPERPLHFIDPPAMTSMTETKPSPQVFVSYAWSDGSAQVDALCETLAAQGLEVVRDKTHAEVGTRLSSFMRRLAAGDFILVVLSPRYLRSPNCMTELFEIYRSCGDEPERFLQRVIPLVQRDAAISSLGDRIDHAQYWKDQADALEAKVVKLGAHNLGAQAMLEYRRIHEFARHVSEMLSLVNDRLIPRDFERMHAEGFAELLALMTPKDA